MPESPLRILIYNDYYGAVGGAEVYLDNLIPLLKSNNIEVQRIGFIENESDPVLKKWNVIRHALLPYKKIKRKMLDAIEAFKPNVIHIHNNRLYTRSILSAIGNIPLVQTVHDPYQYWPPDAKPFDGTSLIKQFARGFKNKVIERHINHIITHSVYLRMIFMKYGYHDRTTHIPLFLDVDGWRRYQNIGKTNAIAFAGRIETYKGIFTLLDAYEILKKKHPKLILAIYGHGSAYQELQKRVKSIGDKRIKVFGMVDLPTLQKGVAMATVAVVPSIWDEPFGLAGIEAQTCGTAVVASRCGGIPEWCIDGVTGLCAEPGNAADLAEKIDLLLTDDVMRENVIQQAYTHLNTHFSKEKHYLKLVEVYRQLLNEGDQRAEG